MLSKMLRPSRYLSRTDPMAFIYLDSVSSKSKDIDFSQHNFDSRLDPRFKWIFLLSRIGGRKLNALTDKIQTEIIEGSKIGSVFNKVWGVAEEGNYYRAQLAIPATLTETEDFFTRAIIIWQASIKKETRDEQAAWNGMDKFIAYENNYIFFVPN